MSPTSIWRRERCVCLLVAVFLAGCSPAQSVLHPAGQEAAGIARLFWIMAAAGAVIWAAVVGTAIYAVVGRHRPATERFADRFILFAGVVFPTIALAALLGVGLALLPKWQGRDAPDLRVHVGAEQFWWRITYETPEGRLIESANEVHLPANAVIEFHISSPDVIHSFWIPALGGKMDAIPGRINVMRLTPTTAGTYRGVCSEYCGLSHALMAFVVVVHPEEEFVAWLAAEQASVAVDAAPFRRAGCVACHSIRGTMEAGRIGPDLTHLASRQSIGAGLLPTTRENLRGWLTATDRLKPDVHMPAYSMLSDAEIDRLVAAMMELK